MRTDDYIWTLASAVGASSASVYSFEMPGNAS